MNPMPVITARVEYPMWGLATIAMPNAARTSETPIRQSRFSGASNAAMKPIIVPAASVEIQGRVIGVLRKY